MKIDFQRMTPQRRVILEELRKLCTHPTADELYEIVRRRLPRISLGTVYRNLDLLSKAGAVRRLQAPGSPARFDGDLHTHYHIHCVVCGRVDDVDGLPLGINGPQLDNIGESRGAFSSYRLLGYRIDFSGVCPACQRNSGNIEGDTSHAQH